MSQIIRRTLGSRWLLVLGLMVFSAAIWGWQAHAQTSSTQGKTSAQTTSQSSIARQGTRSNWECRKFIFGREYPPIRNNTMKDIEDFLQTATQVTMTSSGIDETGTYPGRYDVIACRQP